VRVLLVDDQELVREGFKILIEGDRDIEVVDTADTGLTALEAVRRHRPDVVVMDVRMPDMDGLEATRQLVADDADARVLVLTTYQLEEYLFEALRAGASGFLAKDVAPDELRRAIRIVAGGQALLSPTATRTLIEAYVATPECPDDSMLTVLTDREQEVLALAGRGRDNAEIGRQLFLSPATVKTHLNRAMTKLGAHDRAQLVILAYETGLVRPGGA
jgi:DNA-binding NarL/FixJ family response regulator